MAIAPIQVNLYYTGTRRVLTMPTGFKTQVTVHLWGGGGGAGGHDGGGYGAAGAGGKYTTGTYTVNPGDVIEIDVGGGGGGGVSGASSAAGGPGGSSRLNLGSYDSFSGGTGGTAGPSGSSGGGGGGAGATLFSINGTLAAVAGGGGGGGGAGNGSSGGAAANSTSGSGTAGSNGAGHSGDGGAGGAGGGGLPGGDGGNGGSGDNGGSGGYTGGGGTDGSGVTPAGTSSGYWVSPYGYAASAESASGNDGMAVILFTPLTLGSLKVDGNWKSVDSAYVKKSGVWRTIVGSWVKVNGVWRELSTAAGTTISFGSYADNFGLAGRPATGSGGSGGGGGGGKIICTKLYEMGLLPVEIYQADQEFGKWLVENDPDTYNGYRAWAEIVVDWMSAGGPNVMPWIADNEMRMHRQVKWSTAWAKDIATPWAEEIAYRAGYSTKGNAVGRALMTVGVPISKAVGIWQRVFGPSKKPAGTIKGMALVAVFVLLKGIVVIGNAVTKKKLKEQLA